MKEIRSLKKITEELRKDGFRFTPQRAAVLEFLVKNENHPTIDEIFCAVQEKFPMVSLATVYKTINALKEKGIINELSLSKGGKRYDINTSSSHTHLICVECNKIVDSEIEDVSEMAQQICQKHHFNYSHYKLNFFGICPECQSKQEKP